MPRKMLPKAHGAAKANTGPKKPRARAGIAVLLAKEQEAQLRKLAKLTGGTLDSLRKALEASPTVAAAITLELRAQHEAWKKLDPFGEAEQQPIDPRAGIEGGE